MINTLPISNKQMQTLDQTATKLNSTAEAHSQFADHLKTAVENVNNANKASDNMTKALANGEVEDLHEVMIASEKASITTQTSIEIRNKVIDAYKEIMRMQV